MRLINYALQNVAKELNQELKMGNVKKKYKKENNLMHLQNSKIGCD